MSEEFFPHKVLLDCECLLQELADKYPNSLLSVLRSLKEIKRIEDLCESIKIDLPEDKEERKRVALAWLEENRRG